MMKKLRELHLDSNYEMHDIPSSMHALADIKSMSSIDKDIRDFFENNSRVMLSRISVYEGPFTHPKQSNYMIVEYESSIIDYSMRHEFDESETISTSYSISLDIFSESPYRLASYLKENFFGNQILKSTFSETEHNEMVTPVMVRDYDLLPYIYSPPELIRIYMLLQNEGFLEKMILQEEANSNQEINPQIYLYFCEFKLDDLTKIFANELSGLIGASKRLHPAYKEWRLDKDLKEITSLPSRKNYYDAYLNFGKGIRELII